MLKVRAIETEFSSPDSRDARNGKKTRFIVLGLSTSNLRYRKEMGTVENLAIIVDFRVNETLQIGLSRFSGSRQIGIGNSAYQVEGESVYLFLESAIRRQTTFTEKRKVNG